MDNIGSVGNGSGSGSGNASYAIEEIEKQTILNLVRRLKYKTLADQRESGWNDALIAVEQKIKEL